MIQHRPFLRRCPGCGKRPGQRQLFCHACWGELPAELRSQLALTYERHSPTDPTPKRTRRFNLALALATQQLLRLELFPLDRRFLPPRLPAAGRSAAWPPSPA